MHKRAFFFVCVLALEIGACGKAPATRSDARAGRPSTVIFVCEHGAAKSVVAAAYFNRLAEERHLTMHAVARGLTPQQALSASAVGGLHADGLSPDLTRPVALHDDEVHAAARVVSFLPLPQAIAAGSPLIEWDDVPATGDGYGAARDKIVAHVEALLDELARN